MVYSIKEPEKKIALSKSCAGPLRKGRTMIMAEAFYDPDNEKPGQGIQGNLSKAYSYGAHGVEVQVDKETAK